MTIKDDDDATLTMIKVPKKENYELKEIPNIEIDVTLNKKDMGMKIE